MTSETVVFLVSVYKLAFPAPTVHDPCVGKPYSSPFRLWPEVKIGYASHHVIMFRAQTKVMPQSPPYTKLLLHNLVVKRDPKPAPAGTI